MKAPFHSACIRVVFIVVAAVAAYFVGQQHGDTQRTSIAASKESAKNGSLFASMVVSSPSHSLLTRDKALERWKTALATPNGVVSSWFKIMPELNPSDISYLIDQLSNLPRTDDRDFAIAHLYLGLNDPDAAISLVGKGSWEGNHSNAMNDIYRFMAEQQDRPTVMTELANLPPGEPAQDAYYNVFRDWAGSNSSSDADVAALAVTLSPGEMRMQALNAVAAGWANQDPAAAFAWASNLTPPEDSATMINVLNEMNPNEAAQYVDNLTDASARNVLIGKISLSMSHTNPAAALDWLDEEATGDNYDSGIISIFASLAKSEPAIAASYLDKVTDPTLRSTVISDLAVNWAKYNPQAALTWLQSLPDTDAAIRDVLLQKLTEHEPNRS